jgi:hypothetical protein
MKDSFLKICSNSMKKLIELENMQAGAYKSFSNLPSHLLILNLVVSMSLWECLSLIKVHIMKMIQKI